LLAFRVPLSNTFAHLEPGGLSCFVLPDLQRLARRYLDPSDPSAAITSMEETGLGHTQRDRGLRRLLRARLGTSCHLWTWDFESIQGDLAARRFEQIRRAEIGDSVDPKLDEIEAPVRWQGQPQVECFRPEAPEAYKAVGKRT